MDSKPAPMHCMPPVDNPYPQQPPADQIYPPQQPGEQPNPSKQPADQLHPPQQPADQPYPPPGYQPGYISCQYHAVQAPVITQQPAYQQTSNTTVVVNQQVVPAQRATRNWSSGLCSFFQDCESCKYRVEPFLCDHLPYPVKFLYSEPFVLVSEDLSHPNATTWAEV